MRCEDILVSGATGFVGSRLIRALTKEGRVFALVRNAENASHLFDTLERRNIVLLEADFRRPESLAAMGARLPRRCYLVHLGAKILGNASQTEECDVEDFFSCNAIGTYHLLTALRGKLTGVCLGSTLDVYGRPTRLPIDEEHPTVPRTFYAASKLAAEHCASIELNGRVSLTVLRLSHIYGRDDPHKKVLQTFMDSVREGKRPVIYGDGQDLRDYVHIDDVVEVIRGVIKSKISGVFNVATGVSVSLSEMAQKVINAANVSFAPLYRCRKNQRIDYVFDVTKLHNELKAFMRTTLDEGIRAAVSNGEKEPSASQAY